MFRNKLFILFLALLLVFSETLFYIPKSVFAANPTHFPTSIEIQSNLTGNVSSLRDVIDDTSDATWITAADGTVNTDLYVFMDDPVRNLQTGVNLQEVKALLRKSSAGGGDVSAYVEVHEWINATTETKIAEVSQLISDTTSPVILSVKFDANLLTDKSGRNVKVRIVGITPGGSKANKRTLETAAINFIPTLVPVPAPSNFRLSSQTSNSNTLSWDSVVGVLSYQLKRNGTVIYTGSNTSFTDSGLGIDLYKYELVSIDGTDTSTPTPLTVPLGLDKQTITLTPNATSSTQIDTFESATRPFTYTTDTSSWTRSTASFKNGSYSFASTNTGNSSQSDVKIQNVQGPTTVSFWYRTSSEANYDFLNFYVDGANVLTKSGSVPWTYFEYSLPSGNHVLKWNYTKDGVTNVGEDKVYIDDVSITSNTYSPSTVTLNAGQYYGVSSPNNLSSTPMRVSTNGGSTWGSSVNGLTVFDQLTKRNAYTNLMLEHTVTSVSTLDYYYLASNILPPSNFRTSNITETSIQLNWDVVGNADEYILKRNGTEIYRGTNLSFMDTGLTPKTTYTYSIFSSNAADGASGASIISVQTLTDTPPNSVTNFVTTDIKKDRISFSWDSVPFATEYILKKGSTVVYTGSGTTFTNTNLLPDTPYTYYIIARNSKGESGAVSLNTRTKKAFIETCPASGGVKFSAYLDEIGQIWMWGDNTYGQLGDKSNTQRNLPVKVSDFSGNPVTGFIQVSAGANHIIALKDDGTVWAWGNNAQYQLGIGSVVTTRNYAAQVTGVSNIVRIQSGFHHSYAIDRDGFLWAWGNNANGQVGNGNNSPTSVSTPYKITSITNVIDVSGGNYHSVALTDNGSVYTWGGGSNGELGQGSVNTSQFTPLLLAGTGLVKKVSGGQNHTLLLKEDGTVLAFGLNDDGQLGDKTIVKKFTPVNVLKQDGTTLNDIIDIEGAGYLSYAIKSDKTAYSWGSNLMGELSNGTSGSTDRNYPDFMKNADNSLVSNVSCISSNYISSTLYKNDGTKIWTWGYNDKGQIGDNTINTRLNPYQVFGNLLPATPTNVTTPVITSSSVKATWDPVANATSYVVKRNGLEVYRGSNTSFDNAGLVADTTYNYSISAVNNYGESVPVSINTTTKLPTPVYGTITTNSTSANLTWNPVLNATGYKLYRGGVLIYEGPNTSFSDTGLIRSSTYSYSLSAYHSTNQSNSQTINVTLSSIEIIATPLSTDSIKIDFDSNKKGYTDYSFQVLRNGVDIYNNSQVKTTSETPDAVSFIDTGLSPNTTYTYEVLLTATYNMSMFLDNRTTTGTTLGLSLPSPSNLKTDYILHNEVKLSWDSVTESTSYELRRDGVVIYTGTDAYFIDNSLSPNTLYQYDLVALNGTGRSNTVSLSVTTAEGSLDLTSPNLLSDFEMVMVDGSIQTTSASLGDLNISDTRNNINGWFVTVEATPFTEVGATGIPHILPTNSLRLNGIAQVTQTSGPSSLPNILDYSLNPYIDNGPLMILEAESGQGKGDFTVSFINPTLEFLIDTSEKVVSTLPETHYETTITWTIISSP